MGSFNPLGALRAKWAWAAEKPLFWANLILTSGTLLWVFIYPGPITEAGPSDFRLKTWGMFLQLLGAYTVWHDLTSAAQAFGKGGFLKGTWEWLKAGLFGRTLAVHGSASGSVTFSGSARAKQRRDTPSSAPIESRVEALEFNLSRLDDELSLAFKTIEEGAAKFNQQLREESKKREEAHKELEKSLQDAIAGNYSVLAFGAFWVVIGIVVSALAPEIAKIVAGQWPQVWAAM